MRETAFLTRGLRITLVDERGEGHRAEFHYEGGIVDFVAYLNRNKEPIHKKMISFSGESDEGAVEVAMQWNSSYQESVFSFANNINTIEGGSHLTGFRSALTSALNKYARDKGELKEKDENLTGEDVREGLTAVISAKLTDPQFEGQTKTKLGNPGMQGFVHSIVNARLAEFLEENPQDARAVIRKAVSGGAGARGGAQGARPDPAQVGARELDAARQARRLLGQGPVAGRAVRRRGRLRRRLGGERPRPQHAGDPAAARQDPQRREEPDRQGARQHRDPGADHRDRHRRARRVRHRQGALPQGRAADRRRRRRRAHPHARADAAVPRDAAADRGRLRVHRQAAAVPADPRPEAPLHRARVRARGDPARRQVREDRGLRPLQQAVQADRGALEALHAAAQAVRGLGLGAARGARPGRRHVPPAGAAARGADHDVDALLRHVAKDGPTATAMRTRRS